MVHDSNPMNSRLKFPQTNELHFNIYIVPYLIQSDMPTDALKLEKINIFKINIFKRPIKNSEKRPIINSE